MEKRQCVIERILLQRKKAGFLQIKFGLENDSDERRMFDKCQKSRQNHTDNCSTDDKDLNMDIFKSDSFAESLTKNFKEGQPKSNSGSVDVCISSPFRNTTSGFVHWSVVYGNFNDAWMLKASFLSAYVRTVLTSLHCKNEDIIHTGSYYGFNIRSFEFGEASKWKRTKNCRGKIKTTSRVSFVFSCKIGDEGFGIPRLKKILDKIAWAMKKRVHNLIGETLFKHCEKEEHQIFEYFMDENHNDEKAVKEKITAAVDAAFKNGLNIRYRCHLNQFMVDYDIIHVLRNDMGYSAWAELTDVECGICFKNYSNRKTVLPDCNIEEESFNNY
jgi:hypothetical protein